MEYWTIWTHAKLSLFTCKVNVNTIILKNKVILNNELHKMVNLIH